MLDDEVRAVVVEKAVEVPEMSRWNPDLEDLDLLSNGR